MLRLDRTDSRARLRACGEARAQAAATPFRLLEATVDDVRAALRVTWAA